MSNNSRSQAPTYDIETAKGGVRFLILVVSTLFIGVFGAINLDNIDPVALGEKYRETYWILSHISPYVMTVIAAVFNWSSLRYIIAPVGAFTFVMISGAYYVKDIYNLPSFMHALKYVIASMFGVDYPALLIEKGAPQIPKNATNLIDKIGGPGFVVIEPGNAAMFRALRGPTGVSVSATYFLAPFERLAQAVNLDDQQGDKDEIKAVTRDGIQVVLRDIHFRYRIQQEQRNGQPIRRSLNEPYPFSESALKNVAFNLQVQKDGLDKWNAAVERAVTGAITDFVAARTIDYLTAPRTNTNNPRIELNDELFFSPIRSALQGLGAELLWADVGHLEIVDEIVDEQRANLWAADWIGDAAVVRAFGDAKRQAYQELGRAEAQAELILSIADAMASASPTERAPENIRKLLLARTAQVLDAITDSKEIENKKEKDNP